MVTLQRLRGVFFASVFLAAHCNTEVGNPENEFSGYGSASSSIQSLNLNLTALQPCTTAATGCTAVPVTLGDSSQGNYTFEMTQAKLQLSAIELAPYAAAQTFTSVDLITGTQVSLAEAVDSALVTRLNLSFAGNETTKTRTLELRGNLVAQTGGKTSVVPLRLVYSMPITAITTANTGGAMIQAAQFDAAVWFDLSAAGKSAANLLANLSGGPCSTLASSSCQYYQDALARLVGERISKSLSIKTKPINQNAISKGKVGG